MLSLKSVFLSHSKISLVYFSRMGGVLVGLFFLPKYSAALGTTAFGSVALILSLQAMMLIVDLGASVLVGKDVAAYGVESPRAKSTIKGFELSLILMYIGVAPIVVFAVLFLGGAISLEAVLAAVCLVASLTLQNVWLSALFASGEFWFSCIAQLIGVIARAALTLIVLTKVSATAEAYIYCQAVVAVVHCLITRHVLLKMACKDTEIMQIGRLLKRGLPLVVSGILGGAVMQLDKTLVSTFFSIETLGPYFLAFSLSTVPVTILAGPLKTYFQPLVVKSAYSNSDAALMSVLVNYSALSVVFVGFPVLVLWTWLDELLLLWIGNAETDLLAVKQYARILLPGFAIASIGYVPLSYMVAKEDFSFQAKTSAYLGVFAIIGMLLASVAGEVENLCWVYLFYFSAALLVYWLRMFCDSGSREFAARVFLIFSPFLFLLILVLSYTGWGYG